MEPSNMSEKSERVDHPPAYHADPGPVPAQVGYASAPGAVPVQYGAQLYPAQVLYPGQPTVTVQPTVFMSPALQAHPIPDYLAYSIFTMLCCCFPLGIAALIYSINTRDANLTGNREMAMRNSQVSRLLNNIALGLGIVSYIIGIIFIIVSATTAYRKYGYH